ncbi:hypothetical protein O7635_17730 [Asanoa sp. WMMD1127]|uniref:hypothetical protein n=1 Tax=Asanoa sp. WMMD1127 TaxID=3016107 RepID=UPI002417A488|nr:hypothetical protein [Asanoa sp. WMMD1127]MDG4823699.1 hypothetical protein [Asanoa sp. WMMD1127]
MADLDELAGRLDHELPEVAWAEAESIRSRGHTRRRRRPVVLAAAGVLVIAAGAGWLTAIAGPVAPPVTADGSAAGADPLPPSALLQPEDVGPGYTATDSEVPPGAYPALPVGGGAECLRHETPDIASYRSFLRLRRTQIERPGAAVFAEAGRFADPTGVVDDIGRMLRSCAGGQATGSASPAISDWSVVDEDFAGDESILVRLEVQVFDGRVPMRPATVAAVVRVGDLVATVFTASDDPDQMRLLGERAAARLCAVDNTC